MTLEELINEQLSKIPPREGRLFCSNLYDTDASEGEKAFFIYIEHWPMPSPGEKHICEEGECQISLECCMESDKNRFLGEYEFSNPVSPTTLNIPRVRKKNRSRYVVP